MTHFNGPIVSSSESEVISTSTGLVASVTWPALRYPCSLAGSFQGPRLLKHLDGNLRATIRPIRTKICSVYCTFDFCVNISNLMPPSENSLNEAMVQVQQSVGCVRVCLCVQTITRYLSRSIELTCVGQGWRSRSHVTVHTHGIKMRLTDWQVNVKLGKLVATQCLKRRSELETLNK